jgi:hypothetical protein
MSNDKDLERLVGRVGKLLARTEAGLAAAYALDDALIARADEVDATRLADMERQRALLERESDPAKLRAIERQYLAAAVDRDRARRVARYLRDRRAARRQAQEWRGRPLIRA